MEVRGELEFRQSLPPRLKQLIEGALQNSGLDHAKATLNILDRITSESGEPVELTTYEVGKVRLTLWGGGHSYDCNLWSDENKDGRALFAVIAKSLRSKPRAASQAPAAGTEQVIQKDGFFVQGSGGEASADGARGQFLDAPIELSEALRDRLGQNAKALNELKKKRENRDAMQSRRTELARQLRDADEALRVMEDELEALEKSIVDEDRLLQIKKLLE